MLVRKMGRTLSSLCLIALVAPISIVRASGLVIVGMP